MTRPRHGRRGPRCRRRLAAAGHWREGDRPSWSSSTRVRRDGWPGSWLTCRWSCWAARSDRVMQRRAAAPARHPGPARKHGGELALADRRPGGPQVTTSTLTSRYGMAVAAAWDRVHPGSPPRRLAGSPRPAAGHRGNLDPAAGGSPARRPRPQAVWLWFSPHRHARARWTGAGRRTCAFRPGAHLRLFKQVLGWTVPKIRDRPPRTGGPGWSSPATPSSGSPARWLMTAPPWERPRAGCSGRVRRGSGTSARQQAARPVRRNPAKPDAGGRQDQRTPPSTSTSRENPQTGANL